MQTVKFKVWIKERDEIEEKLFKSIVKWHFEVFTIISGYITNFGYVSVHRRVSTFSKISVNSGSILPIFYRIVSYQLVNFGKFWLPIGN